MPGTDFYPGLFIQIYWLSLVLLLTDWLSDWLTHKLTDWLTDWLTDCLTGWLTSWLTGWLTDWPIVWLTDWYKDKLTDWQTDRLTDWLTDWRTDYQIGWSKLVDQQRKHDHRQRVLSTACMDRPTSRLISWQYRSPSRSFERSNKNSQGRVIPDPPPPRLTFPFL